MGTCFSKKNSSSSSLPTPAATACDYGRHVVVDDSNYKYKPKSVSEAAEPAELKLKVKKPRGKKEEKIEEQETQIQVKKEVFVIKHRKSHDERGGDRDCKKSPLAQNQIQHNLPQQQQPSVSDGVGVLVAASASPPQIATALKTGSACNELVDDVNKVVRTQSCNKEELEAILIHCGRLSRSNSSGNNRKYSGSKRSYDFDANDGRVNVNDICHDDDDGDGDGNGKTNRRRQSSRSRPSSPSSQGRRRRTPSRERNQQQQQQRSSSRERQTSRSPGKRSSSQQNASSSTCSNVNGNANFSANSNHRPGKMVSVPAASISSLAMVDKTNNIASHNGEAAASVKRILVKRNVGSPRCRSPARGAAPCEGQQQQPSLSRSSSRKAEHSPYRRNPLAEIDPNSLGARQARSNSRGKREIQPEEDIVVKEANNLLNQAPTQKPTLEINNNRIAPQGVNYITSSTSAMDNNKAMNANYSAKEWQQNVLAEEAKGQPQGKPQALTRSRSSRRSRDLDVDFETTTTPSNPAPSLYTSLLLQDIQNFHQQNTTTNGVSIPSCVTKACSILEAVADLNSETKSTPTDQTNKKNTPGPGYNCSLGANCNLAGKSIVDQPKDPFVESEVVVNDDLMEPSFHKYVTVRRGTGALEGGLLDMEDQESSGSNSFVSGTSHSQQHHWGLSSSLWEPNSTDCWTSRSNTREECHNHKTTPVSFDMDESARKRLSRRKRDSDDHHNRSSGIGRGRLGAANTKGLHTIRGVAAAASM